MLRFCGPRTKWAAYFVATLSIPFAPAFADDAGRARAAQLATMARTAAILCPDLRADEEGLRAFMTGANLSDHDLMDPAAFGVQDQLAARQLAQSFKDNGVQTCADMAACLGPSGAGLIRLKGATDQ